MNRFHSSVLALFLSVVVSASQGWASEDIRVPNGIDLSRLKKIDAEFKSGKPREQRLMVYATMTAINDKDAHMLFPAHVGQGMGSPEQLRQRFKTTISATNRFDFRDERQTDVVEGIIVEAMVTAAKQDLEDYRAFLKSVTTVRMSVAVKDLETGAVLRSKNLSAVYGSDQGEGTIVSNRAALRQVRPGVCQEPSVCQNLENDYDKALHELFDNLGSFIEKTFRPIAKVYDIDGDEITMLGSLKHGFNPEEEVVIFRARPVESDDGKALPPVIKGVAMARCSVGDNLTCRITRSGRNGDVQKGDYAVPSDKMLRLQEHQN
jgi:hypothetical protein